jgi:hypothetical protein
MPKQVWRALAELRSSCQNKYGEPLRSFAPYPKSDENPAKIQIDLLSFNELKI